MEDVREVSLKVLDEMSSQFSGLVSVFSHVSPGLPWSEHEGVRYARAAGDHFKAEVFVSFCLCILQFPSDGRGDHLSAVNDIDSVTFTKGAFRPACVYEINPGLVLSEALAQKFSIGQKLPGHEGQTKAWGKGWYRFFDPHLGSCQLACVTGQELIHGLLRREPANRWHYPGSIRGQEEYDLWMFSHAGETHIVNILARIGSPGIFGNGIVCKVQIPVFQDHVFGQGTKSSNRTPDIPLFDPIQVDQFCITAAFKVKIP